MYTGRKRIGENDPCFQGDATEDRRKRQFLEQAKPAEILGILTVSPMRPAEHWVRQEAPPPLAIMPPSISPLAPPRTPCTKPEVLASIPPPVSSNSSTAGMSVAPPTCDWLS